MSIVDTYIRNVRYSNNYETDRAAAAKQRHNARADIFACMTTDKRLLQRWANIMGVNQAYFDADYLDNYIDGAIARDYGAIMMPYHIPRNPIPEGEFLRKLKRLQKYLDDNNIVFANLDKNYPEWVEKSDINDLESDITK